MARSPRTAVAPPPPPSTISSRPSRRRQSVTSTAPSTPYTPAPGTPDASSPFTGFTPSTAGPSRPPAPIPGLGPGVGGRGHALRSVGAAAAERTPCPFPAEYGGREKCGIHEEDEADEVLMAGCGALALLNNRALSPEDLARISVENGWIRPPTAAVEPTAPFNASIRNHFKRCEKSTPPRQPLLSKYQLTGAVAEQILQPALHPDAFFGGARPKGTVYFLSVSGKMKWKNPFAGIEVPKTAPKKPGPVKKYGKEKKETVKSKEAAGHKGKSKLATVVVAGGENVGSVPPVKLRLFLNPGAAVANKEREEREKSRASVNGDVEMDGNGSSRGPSVPVSRDTSGGNSPIEAIPSTTVLPVSRRKIRRPSRTFDSTDESDTSDSDDDASIPTTSRFPRLNRALRRPAPAPISISGSPRFPYLTRLPQGSPFKELFFPTSPHASSAPFPCPPSPHASPFPTHSLDNTLWTVRTGAGDGYTFEDSSSSSDEEMRDPDWGQTSGILIRADDEEVPVWAGETEDEAKIKEATDALRVLFPMTNTNEGMEENHHQLELNRLDNDRERRTRPFSSDASSIAESTSTAAPLRQHRSAGDIPLIPLNTWLSNHSPAPSPLMRNAVLLPPVDSNPTGHLPVGSALGGESMEMEIDEEISWLDESGEGPIRADPDETLSDSEIVSQPGGDMLSSEHDRQLHTAEWAREAAVFSVKKEIVDYPSPGLTECDEPEGLSPHDVSRASSAETQDPCSASSGDISVHDGVDGEGVDEEGGEYENTCGPESMTVEDVDGLYNPLLPLEKTPQRGKKGRGRTISSAMLQHRRTSSGGLSGKIGVGALTSMEIPSPRNPSPVKGSSTRTRSLRPSTTRRRKSDSDPVYLPHPPSPPLTDGSNIPTPPRPTDIDIRITESPTEWLDAIGTADLDLAMAEAEAKEEERRALHRRQSEERHALREAYRQRIGSSPDGRIINWDAAGTGFSDLAGGGSTNGSMTDLSVYHSGAMSPMALQSMSMLSLKEMPQSVDPRALRSPPIRMDGMNMGIGMGTEELMGDVVMDGSTAISPLPPPNVELVTPTPVPVKQVSIPKAGPAPPTAQPIAPPPHVAPPPPAPTAAAQPPQPRPRPPPPASQASTPGSTQSTAQPVPRPPPKTDNHHIAVPLCNGVRISVISMIPVYFLKHTSKLGEFTVIRRIDSDYVNATSLLLALGLPKNKHSAIISPLSNALPSSKEVTEPADLDMGYEPGVLGLWIRLSDARFLRDRFKGYLDCPVWALLNDDIVEKFVAIIKNQDVQHIHTSKDNFGSNFQATPRNPSASSAATSSSSTPTSSTSRPDSGPTRGKPLPPPSAANRKPGPPPGPIHHRANSAAAAAPHPRPLAPTTTSTPGAPKGPLIRPANTNPDECPTAKRRRATVVGTSPIKSLVPPKPTGLPISIAPSKNVNPTNGTNIGKPQLMVPAPTKLSPATVQNTSVTSAGHGNQAQVSVQIPGARRVHAPIPASTVGMTTKPPTTAGNQGGRPIAPAQSTPVAKPTPTAIASTARPTPMVNTPKITPKPTAPATSSAGPIKQGLVAGAGGVGGSTAASAAAAAAAATRRTTRASVGGETKP